jgi:hypothetical protein
MKRTIAILFVVLISAVLTADELRMACEYSDKGVQVEFDKNGKPKISLGEPGMSPFILSVDLETGDAKLIANSTVEVLLLPAGNTMNFIEPTGGGVNIITVFSGSVLAGGKSVPFAQARHLDVGGPFPQQYYGICTDMD